MAQCKPCRGTGYVKCTKCGGGGEVTVKIGHLGHSVTCPRCRGRKRDPEIICGVCKGTKVAPEDPP